MLLTVFFTGRAGCGRDFGRRAVAEWDCPPGHGALFILLIVPEDDKRGEPCAGEYDGGGLGCSVPGVERTTLRGVWYLNRNQKLCAYYPADREMEELVFTPVPCNTGRGIDSMPAERDLALLQHTPSRTFFLSTFRCGNYMEDRSRRWRRLHAILRRWLQAETFYVLERMQMAVKYYAVGWRKHAERWKASHRLKRRRNLERRITRSWMALFTPVPDLGGF